MRELPDVTLIAIDTHKYGETLESMKQSLALIKPGDSIWFTDIYIDQPFRIESIKHLYSKEEYSAYCLKELGKYAFKTSHVLITQWDGHVLFPEQWDDAWLQYDYIGASWPGETDGFDVGNGGFSLRSAKLLKILAEDPMIRPLHPEDAQICRLYRSYLEDKYQIKFAPRAVADKFAFELREPADYTFGFHGKFHAPYQEPIVIRRTAALGDVIQLEPVMEYFWKLGHKVILDSPFFQIFSRHHFPIHDYKRFDHQVIKHRVIDMDLAYEVMPAQLHLKSYFQIAGIKDYVLRNPKLNYQAMEENRIFKKYVVIHIDRRETTHRNVHGINWERVKVLLEDEGYQVIQIGKGGHEKIALHYNTVNDLMLMWLCAGASLFIGVDSGPSHVAVALGIPSVIFFGSVNPAFIHADLSNIVALQSPCPVGKDHCWHSTSSTRGSNCVVDLDTPPCTVLNSKRVLEAIQTLLP